MLILKQVYRWPAGAIVLAALMTSCSKPPSVQQFETVTISNVQPRRDVNGEIVDAHDGCLRFFNGIFYLYGTGYGKSNGYGTNNHYRVYSSPDLGQWTFERELFQHAPTGVYYRPYVVFNVRTKKYVLWYNWYPKLWNGQTGVAVSDTPTGPFTIVNTNVRLHAAVPGDGSLFVDNDGTGYYIYTALNEGGTIRVERLTPDYLASTGETSGILAMGTESPLLFRRENLYYALCGPRCAFCPEGSEVQFLTATSPLGPYTAKSQSVINRQPEGGVSAAAESELWAVAVSSADATNVNERLPDGSGKKTPMIIRTKNRPLIDGQETSVAMIPMGGEPVFIWMADRWGSCPDGIKGHDFQFWSMPLGFGTNGDILPIRNVPEWHIEWAKKH